MSAGSDRVTTVLADRYRIERELGAGGMATVYLAADLKHDRKVAIKVLKPELAAVLGAERFVQEIKTTAALSHPHILPLFDSGEAGGFLYYVMPYIQGETIREKLNRETQFGIDEAVKIATEVAEALDYAHRHGVIHRDIKPENILLHDGRPMVMDFGIALAVSAAAGGRMTETGLSLGTPHYMSPEQATADKDITARSDIYSLASVLYEMLAGVPPHEGGSAQQTIMRIITETAKPVADLRKSVPPNVAAAIAHALEKLPADRFDSAKRFAEALANPAFAAAAGDARAGASARSSTRSTALIATLVTLVLLASGLGAWGWLRATPKPVIRYALTFPDGRVPTGLAIAPDGSWLVYAASGNTPGQTQLWVKARDRMEATPLSGTDGAHWPAVSPDGAWIGFNVAGSVRRIPAQGGTVSTIADSSFSGPVWLDDHTVAYTDFGSRVRTVPVAGGESRILFAPRADQVAGVLAPLPNGRGVLLLRCSANATCTPTQEVWVVDGRTGDAALLLSDVGWASYADGRLLFVRRDGEVFAVPFDLGTLRMQGTPVPLFGGMRLDFVNGPMPFLSASGSLLYSAGPRGSAMLEAVWVSRDGRAVPVDTAWDFTPSTWGTWALSPDGRRLAISLSTAGNPDIWIKELDRGSLSRLTFSDSMDLRPRWTPDGRSVTFHSNRAGNWQLFARRADGIGADSLVLALPTPIWEALWSRDKHWLVVRLGGTHGAQAIQKDVAVLRVGRDTVPRPLLNAEYDELNPALSPDGRWLAYVSNETGRREVFVRPFPGVDSGKWQVSVNGGVNPVWSHSGRELFFIDERLDLVSQSVPSGAVFQGGEQRVLFNVAGYVRDPDFSSFELSPDDQRFLMVRDKAQATGDAPPVVIVVENWLEEVKARMRK